MYEAVKYDCDEKTFDVMISDDLDKIDQWIGDTEDYSVKIIEEE